MLKYFVYLNLRFFFDFTEGGGGLYQCSYYKRYPLNKAG